MVTSDCALNSPVKIMLKMSTFESYVRILPWELSVLGLPQILAMDNLLEPTQKRRKEHHLLLLVLLKLNLMHTEDFPAKTSFTVGLQV
jgi:hypothetical protein